MILISFGTRPEWIKIKPIIDQMRGKIPFKLLFTGQHTSPIDKGMENYEHDSIRMENDLLSRIGCNNRLDEIVSSILRQFGDQEYSAVMVQGDTTSAFAVALAAFHRRIPVIHLEAGLRTFDKHNPYPEEFNRTAISALTEVHLCPTETSAMNIIQCTPNGKQVHVVGNTVLDHLVGIQPRLDDVVLFTMHRRENHHNIHEWFNAINDIAREEKLKYDGLEFICPMHPNPDVAKHADILKQVKVVPPLSHKDCIDYISRCKFAITDSGGIQEEACFLKKKCIVCRKVTERVEGIGDFAFLCERPSDLRQLVYKLKETKSLVDKDCPYGDGHSAEKIMSILSEFYNAIGSAGKKQQDD